ncbi:hypothetical protein LCGC14_1525140 [marine sediment metagenome]|uniref:Uncharacterized protein n=1 Tax=marine sediment metagenome TaxID=412755 RepID=A0A0F9LCZ1_9ZZZZ
MAKKDKKVGMYTAERLQEEAKQKQKQGKVKQGIKEKISGFLFKRKEKEKERSKAKQKITEVEKKRTVVEERRLNFVGYVLAKKFNYVQLMMAADVETAKIEGREVHGYMYRMFPDYDWLITNWVLDRAVHFAYKDYRPIVHNFVKNFDFDNCYRSLVTLSKKDFFRHSPELEFDRLAVLSSKPLKEDLTWIANYKWLTDDGYETTMLFAPCNFLNMGSPLHDLPVLVVKDAVGKSELFFKAKTTAQDLTKQKDEIIRKEIFKLREKEREHEEQIDELEIESEGARKMYHTLKYKMLNRAPYASDEEFEKFEKKEMGKINPFGSINYKRILTGIIVMILVALIIVAVGFVFVRFIIPQPTPTEIPPDIAGLLFDTFRGGT